MGETEGGEFEAERVVAGGSDGVSGLAASGSLCKPTGLRGRRSVPLFGAGTIPTESHSRL